MIAVGAALAVAGCGTGDSSVASVTTRDPSVAEAAVRPAGEARMEALAQGVLRADAESGCLWLEHEDGRPAAELLLHGESYRVDFSAAPASVLDGGTVVARAGELVEVTGGFTDRVEGVEGCPADADTFLGGFDG